MTSLQGHQDVNSTKYVFIRDPNHQQLFYEKADYDEFLQQVKKYHDKYGCELHAYALLPEQVYLVISLTKIIMIPKILNSIQYNFSRYYNYKYRRITRLLKLQYSLESIYPSSRILNYYRYVEFAPVRLRITNHPADYPWSSFGCNAMGEDAGMISPHHRYTSLGNDNQTRWKRYRDMVEEKNSLFELSVL